MKFLAFYIFQLQYFMYFIMVTSARYIVQTKSSQHAIASQNQLAYAQIFKSNPDQNLVSIVRLSTVVTTQSSNVL